MFGTWTKLKYHNKPIHITPATTWKYLNSQLQKSWSIAKPPEPKDKNINIIDYTLTLIQNIIVDMGGSPLNKDIFKFEEYTEEDLE